MNTKFIEYQGDIKFDIYFLRKELDIFDETFYFHVFIKTHILYSEPVEI